MGLFGKLLLVFVTVPLLEFVLFWKIGNLIGIPATIAIIIFTGFLGAWLTRLQGLRTLHRYQKTLSEGRMPHREVVDGLLILLAGAVLLTPGFLTDAVGFSLLVPPIRTAVRKRVVEQLRKRIRIDGVEVVPGEEAERKDSGVINVESEVIDEKGKP